MKLLQLGTLNGSPLMADVSYLGGDLAAVSVTFSSDYVMEDPGAGFPIRPCFVGVNPHPSLPRTITAGSTLWLFLCEAAALIAANAAT
jgi:hypothetical protein